MYTKNTSKFLYINTINSIPFVTDLQTLAQAQQEDQLLQNLFQSSSISLKLTPVDNDITVSLICDTSTETPQPYLLFRFPTFEHLHSLSH